LVPLPNWVNWKWELNESGTAWTKVPYQPSDPSRHADHNKKQTWGIYSDAVNNVVAGKADGIGFCLLETNICAFDIDNCRELITD
jgi:primase-polymerase (primpol)-like protein